MVKQFKSKNSSKKLKTLKNITLYPTKKYKKRKNNLKYSQKKTSKEKTPKNSKQNDESIKLFFDAQATIKLNCYVCNKSIINQIKVILDPNYSKEKNFQKGLNFNALCVRCFVLKTKFNSKEKVNYVINEMTLNAYKFTNYKILNKLSENLFTWDWTLGEEIKLLGAIERLGLNNWEEISKILGKGKFECRSHYHAFYYKKQNDYLPNLNNLNNKNKINERKKNKSIENQILSKICKEIGYIPYNIDNNQSNRSVNMSRSNSKSEHNSNKIQLQNACNTLGYWPKRHEFDVEYKNDAEIELMEIDYQEKEKNKAQENMIEIYDKMLFDYNLILEKRDERKNFILENNLYDVKKQSMNEKKLEKEDREIYQSVKQSLKYLTNEQFKEYYEGIILEKNLKSRLNQLLYYYKIGYKTYGQIYKYIYNLKQKSNKIRDRYNIKTNLKNLNVSLRESTVKQVDKLNIK